VTKRKGSSGTDGDGFADEPLPGMGDPAPFRIPPGPVERAVSRSVAAAVKAGTLEATTHAGAIRAAAAVARVVDRLTPSQTQTMTPYQGACAVQAARELSAQLVTLGLTPRDGGDVDPLDALLGGLGSVGAST
jgi:hypothetical protein